METKTNNLSKVCERLFVIYLISLCFGNFFINTGFAIKPYMFISILILLVLLISKRIHKIKIFNYDLIYLLFIIICTVGICFTFYNNLSIRYVAGLAIIYISYTLLKKLLENIKYEKMIDIINKVGLVFSIISLIYYFIGLISLNFSYLGNNISSFGVLIDRSSPRLITFASSDPNISCVLLSIFMFFSFKDIKKYKFTFILNMICIFLTLSRGAIIAVIIGLIINYLFKKASKKEKNMIKTILIFVLMTIILIILNKYGLLEMIFNRFDSSISTGGSGRVELWTKAIDQFYRNPIFGVGINNLQIYIGNTYVHNTYLQVLAETGVVGFLTYILFLSNIGKLSINAYKKSKDNYYILGLTICLFVQMFFLSILIQEVFFAFISILYKLSLDERKCYNEN